VGTMMETVGGIAMRHKRQRMKRTRSSFGGHRLV